MEKHKKNTYLSIYFLCFPLCRPPNFFSCVSTVNLMDEGGHGQLTPFFVKKAFLTLLASDRRLAAPVTSLTRLRTILLLCQPV